MISGEYKTHNGVRYLLYSAIIFIWEPSQEYLRVMGNTPSIFTNWIILKGLE